MSDLQPMTSQQKANPLGAHLLNHYYTNEDSKKLATKKVNYPIYVLNSAKEMPIIMHCAQKEGLNTYGMVVVSGGKHRTPIMIDNNNAYIIESLGTTRSKVGINSVAQVAMSLKQSDVALSEIYTFKDNRQVDSQSCGSDSFIALKQAFRIKDNLDDFVSKEQKVNLNLNNDSIIDQEEKNDPFFKKEVNIVQLKNLPPEIAKYSQNQGAIENYDYRNRSVKNKQDNSPSMTVSGYAKKNLKTSTIPTAEKKSIQIGDEVVELKSRKFIFSNAALEHRRIKHDVLLKNMAQNLSADAIKTIIKESSGINLISKHINDIPDKMLSGVNRSNTATKETIKNKDVLIEDYVTEEMHKKRDEKTGLAPKGKMNLIALSKELKDASKSVLNKKPKS